MMYHLLGIKGEQKVKKFSAKILQDYFRRYGDLDIHHNMF